ncbi:MAG: hypothetical protein PGN29_18725, partial [Gordonia paraffinivorans]
GAHPGTRWPRSGAGFSDTRSSAVQLPPKVVTDPIRGVAAVIPLVTTSVRATHLRAPVQIVRGARQSSNAKGVRDWPRDSRDCYVTMMR